MARGERRRLDCYWEAERVIVEIDGASYHDLAQRLDDQERQNEMVIQGDRTFLRSSNLTIRYEPEIFMDPLKRALHSQAA